MLRRLAALRSVSGDAQGARTAIEEGLPLARSAGPAAAALLAELATVATQTLGIPEVRAVIARGLEVC
ncbi:MAG: hypothetical protein ACRENL_12435 [Candidatus Dormibacteria bacterium]